MSATSLCVVGATLRGAAREAQGPALNVKSQFIHHVNACEQCSAHAKARGVDQLSALGGELIDWLAEEQADEKWRGE